MQKIVFFPVLGRNVGRNADTVEREQFLQEQLHIPRPWIAEAKAVYASTMGSFGDQAWYLIQVILILRNVRLKNQQQKSFSEKIFSYLFFYVTC